MNEFQAKHQPGVTGSNIYKMAAMCTRFNQSVALNLSLKKNHRSTSTALDMRQLGYRERRQQNNFSDEF